MASGPNVHPPFTWRERRAISCAALYRRHYARARVVERDVQLEAFVEKATTPSTRLLDAGCGWNAEWLAKFAPNVAAAVGVDLVASFRPIDPRIRLCRANAGQLPFADNVFDIVMTRSLLEHLEIPQPVFDELSRVTRPGGILVMTTPTKWDYGSIAARLTSTHVHRRFLRWIGVDGADYDNFPTRFRANTRQAVTALAQRAGLELIQMTGISHPPYYLRFSSWLYGLGIAYDRFISRMRWEELMGSWLIVLRKPAGG